MEKSLQCCTNWEKISTRKAAQGQNSHFPIPPDCGIYFVSRLLQQLNFNQRQTRIGKMVNFVTSMLTAASRQSNTQSDLAQLLLIVSDGRGVFSEGRELVEQAVRAAREARVFIVFLAIEDPHSKVFLVTD